MGVKPANVSVTITTAGTRVQCSNSTDYATALYVEALKSNAGTIYVGISTVSATVYISALSPGEGLSINTDSSGVRGGTGTELPVNLYYVDASTSGDKCQLSYITRTGSF